LKKGSARYKKSNALPDFVEDDWDFMISTFRNIKEIIPNLTFAKYADRITVHGSKETGFDIDIFFTNDEVTVSVPNGWHTHIGEWSGCSNKNQALVQAVEEVLSLLSDRCRIRLTFRGDRRIARTF